MPLLQNDKHQRLHGLGPKDLDWGKKNLRGQRSAVMTFNVTRSTIDAEQVSFTIPVFEGDSRADVNDRIGFAFSMVQDRLDDANQAWEEVANAKEAEEALKLEGKKK